jgi:hypothetical protein
VIHLASVPVQSSQMEWSTGYHFSAAKQNFELGLDKEDMDHE